MISKIFPRRLKNWARHKIEGIVAQTTPPLETVKYIPYSKGLHDYMLPFKTGDPSNAAFALPPAEFREGLSLSAEEYLASGKEHIQKMLEILIASGYIPDQGHRILDMGCGAGRMIRHLYDISKTCEIWGADINSPQLNWARLHMSPPFHFTLNTTIPHLPFEDRYFNLIYCGSVFTHIEDLADAWLCELKRILIPGGRLYLTIHDESTINLLETKYKEHWFAKEMQRYPSFAEWKKDFGMMVFGRDAFSQVFYSREYFKNLVTSVGFKILSVTDEAFSYQTAILIERNK